MKNNLIKKFVLYAFVIIYDVVSLLWCYIFIETMIFNFTNTKIGYFGPDVTAHAVGGIDTTSHEFIICKKACPFRHYKNHHKRNGRKYAK